jgi:hypothetical protein
MEATRMTSTKRALTALATGALALPFIYAPAAYAVAPEPPAQQDISQFCSTLPATYNPFVDDEPNTFTAAIECIAFAGIAQGGPRGLPANQYGPAFTVPRDQMASFIARMIDAADELDEGTGVRALPGYDGSNAFVDVSASNVHLGNINRLEAANIVEGGPGGRPANQYGPGIDVTRAQMASFINRAIQYMTGTALSSTNDYFTDDEAFQVHEPNINGIASEGIAVGDGQDVYRPGQPIQRDQMAGFIARSLAVLHEDGVIREVTENAANPDQQGNAGVTLTSQNAQQGGNVTGTITGENIQSVRVSGCGLSNQELGNDSDASAAGRQFTLTIPANQPVGQCTLTFTTTFTNGTTETDTATVNVQDGRTAGTATVRPELVSAQIVKTTTPGQVTPGDLNKAGTVVRYVFDEAITGGLGDMDDFIIYTFDRQEADGDFIQIDPDNSRAVLVRFDEFANTPETGQAADLTLAAVYEGAVVDGDGDTNPIGDAPIGTASQRTLAAGITAAPDLTTVAARGAANPVNANDNPASTVVDFTFDEAAYVVNATGFRLVLVDGEEIDCTGPAAGSTTPASGGTNAGGNGTTTITVVCDNSTAAPTAPITTAQIARGVVETGTVSDAAQTTQAGDDPEVTEGNANPLQASNTPDAASATPDLVSAQFLANGTQPDQVLYTFDEPVLVENQVAFVIYTPSGQEFFSNDAQRSPTNDRQVLATFFEGALASAVGASVPDGAVVEATANDTGRENSSDEVAVTNPATTTVTPGRTVAPELTGVRLNSGTNNFGQRTFTATYIFDEDIEANSAWVNDFYLYLADGERLECTELAPNGGVGTTEDTDNTVTCIAFDRESSDTATALTVGSALLGAVWDYTVISEDSAAAEEWEDLEFNTLGSELTTGGTGTPTA